MTIRFMLSKRRPGNCFLAALSRLQPPLRRDLRASVAQNTNPGPGLLAF